MDAQDKKDIAFLVYDTLMGNTQYDQFKPNEVVRQGVDTSKEGEYFIYFEMIDGREVKLLIQ